MSPLVVEIFLHKYYIAFSSIIPKNMSLNTYLSSLSCCVVQTCSEGTHFWKILFFFISIMDSMSSKEYGWNKSMQSFIEIAECFFLNGKSTLFAIPIMLVLVSED